jgi:hypothetical protein
MLDSPNMNEKMSPWKLFSILLFSYRNIDRKMCEIAKHITNVSRTSDIIINIYKHFINF